MEIFLSILNPYWFHFWHSEEPLTLLIGLYWFELVWIYCKLKGSKSSVPSISKDVLDLIYNHLSAYIGWVLSEYVVLCWIRLTFTAKAGFVRNRSSTSSLLLQLQLYDLESSESFCWQQAFEAFSSSQLPLPSNLLVVVLLHSAV